MSISITTHLVRPSGGYNPGDRVVAKRNCYVLIKSRQQLIASKGTRGTFLRGNGPISGIVRWDGTRINARQSYENFELIKKGQIGSMP